MISRTVAAFFSVAVALVATTTMSAQSPDTKGAISYVHHHLNVTRIEDHQKFWVDGLGGTPLKILETDNVRFSGVLVRLRKQPPTGGTKGSTVNHVGFQVPDLRRALDRVRAAGFPVVTAAEVTSSQDISDDIAYIANQDAYIAFVMGPDDTKVELFENKNLPTHIALHHVHFAAQNVEAMKTWYVKIFGAEPGRRGSFETAELPDVSLRWAASAVPLAGTKGRVLDHIGFEVNKLEAFSDELTRAGVTVDRPFSNVPDLGLTNMFIIDPWGTLIELTDGLGKF